ncbi:MAG: hypothetical protein ACK4QW_17505 [Alphaproteobacteria bacterium]
MPHPVHRAPAAPAAPTATVEHAEGEPFASAADAWFWCVAGETARIDGARPRAGCAETPRPCEPGDILRSVDRLYRARMLLPAHVKVLVHFGRRFETPGGGTHPRRRAARLWAEALERLEPALRAKGIVA